MQETWVQALGWEDPLEEGMATYSSILTWEVMWTEEPCRLQPTAKQQQQKLLEGEMISHSLNTF